MKRIYCKLIKGGWRGDNKEQNYTIIHYDIHRKSEHHFSFKGIGKFQNYNDKELEELTEFINKLLKENKQLKEELNIILNLDYFLTEEMR